MHTKRSLSFTQLFERETEAAMYLLAEEAKGGLLQLGGHVYADANKGQLAHNDS